MRTPEIFTHTHTHTHDMNQMMSEEIQDLSVTEKSVFNLLSDFVACLCKDRVSAMACILPLGNNKIR